MRAGPVDDHEALRGHVAQLGEEPGQEALGRQGARDVGDHHRDAMAGTHDLAQRPGAERAPHRLAEGRRFVGETLDVAGGHDRHVFRGDLDLEPVPAVLEVRLHADKPILPLMAGSPAEALRPIR